MLALSAMDAITDPVTDSQLHPLSCHPQTPCQAIQGIDAVITAAPGDVLTLAFVLECDFSRLRIPAPRSPRRVDGLWAHSCFELFVMAGDGPAYREFNVSPSGEWAVYAFRSYREGEALDVELAPGVAVRRTSNRLQLDAKIRQDFLPPGRPLRLGLSAVMEDVDGKLSYWALQHSPGKPDFHHIDAFALQLELPRMRNVNNLPGGVVP